MAVHNTLQDLGKHDAGEYLGDIDPELLLTSLTNTNRTSNSIDFIRDGLRGKRVTVIARSVDGEPVLTLQREKAS